jgi:hypothetical protein
VPIPGRLLETQAVKFYKKICKADGFNASNDWLSRWKIHHGVTQLSVEGESRSNDSAADIEFYETLWRLSDELEDNEEQLHNRDETALYYRMLLT